MRIRKAKKVDITFLFNLRNDAAVRESAFNSKPIDKETHKQWFNKKLLDKNAIIFIAENNGLKVGQIRFDIDKIKCKAEVDIAIAPKYRAKGYGVKLLTSGCKFIFKKTSKCKKIVAYIKPENEISIRIFSKAGFQNCGCVNHNRIKCVEMVFVVNN
jgi:UDP-2,4-diacetamido-2,4,6-trideoxy-beta-L-altropyranose hydrolase